MSASSSQHRPVFAPENRPALGLLAAATAAKILIFLVLVLAGRTAPFVGDNARDNYIPAGHRILTEGRFNGPESRLDSKVGPAYSVVLAAAMAASPENFVIITVCLQMIGDLVTACLLFWLGARYVSRSAGVLAGMAWLLYPPQVALSTWITAETFFTTGLIASVALLVSALDEERSGRALFAGLMLGVATLFRGTTIVLPVMLVPLMLWRRAYMASVGLVAGMLLVVAPWAIRNAVVLDDPILVSVGIGGAFMQGSDERGFIISGKHDTFTELYERAAKVGITKPATEHEGPIDHWQLLVGMNRYKERLATEPLSIAPFMLKKLLYLWYSTESGGFRGQLLLALSSVAIVPFALLQLWRWRTRPTPFTWVCTAVVVYFILLHIATAPLNRYMLPVYPLLCLAACEWWVETGARLLQAKRPPSARLASVSQSLEADPVMCGIAGIFNYAAVPVDEQAVACRMRDAMVHRGPDASGLYQSPDRRVVLAHRRLSIVDLSDAGRQPMTNEDGTVWVTFNGEIYNHEDYRDPLTAKGHRFVSRSDTEAIIHLYEEFGRDCVSRLDGMFAFAIWDEVRRSLFIARDRLGKKPLYYTVCGGRLLFASEIKALLKHPDVTRDLDREALDYFLTFSNTPAPRTLFRNIFKLPAAHFLLCSSDGTIKTERYWSPLDGPAWPATNGQESVERVRDLLTRAVRKRLMSDVPIGAFLSGGIDSSTNVALMSRLTSEPLRTFSVGFEGFGEAENFHDLPYARQIAREFGCNHAELTVTAEDCQRTLPELVYQQDEPIGDPACLPMHFVSMAAKQHGVTVVLVGEGSDEVFGGYPDMERLTRSYASKWRRLQALPGPVRSAIYGLARVTGMREGTLDVLRRAAARQPFYWGLDVVFSDAEKNRLFLEGSHARLSAGSANVLEGYYAELSARRPNADFLQQMSYVELENRLPELLLMRVDKFSMAHSLEARAPFLDHELVSYGLSLPQRSKIYAGQTKKVLKDAVRGLLPEEVINRRKQGFRVPLPEWLAGPLSGWAEQQLFSKRARELDFFDFDYIRGLWARHKSGVEDQSFDLWCLINVFAWYECWLT